jgi:endonuclease YncB( thermonuclease family)
MKTKMTFLVLIILVMMIPLQTPLSFAHQSGCHSWHSCPSDTGSYTCGDKGYCSQCPDNNYCKAGKPISYSQTKQQKTEPIILKKQTYSEKVSTAVCTGKTMCISGKVKSIVDGDTLYVDTYKIRLSLTNTPEKGQNGYAEATKFTKNLCQIGSAVIVDQDDKQPFDSFKRIVGKVYCSDKNLNSELLYKNYASIMKKYCKTSEFASEPWAKKFGC